MSTDDDHKDQVEIVPSHVRVLANGTWKDTITGKFLPGHKPTTGIAVGDSQRASQMAARRRELAAIAARQALADRAQSEGLQRSPVAAYGLLAGIAYDAASANMMDKPREGVEAGKFALRLAQMLPEADKQAANVAAVQVILAPEVGAWLEAAEWRGDDDAG